MKLTPRSIAWLRAASEVLSSVGPQASPPMPHAPKPIADTFQPVRPSVRYSIFYSPSAYCQASCYIPLPVVYSDGDIFAKKHSPAHFYFDTFALAILRYDLRTVRMTPGRV